METAAPWLRWTRAGTVATVATLLAVGAHVQAGGPTPSLPVLAFLVLGLTAASATLLAGPASALRVVLLTAGGQLVAHHVLAAASAPAVAGSDGRGMTGMAGHHAGHLLEYGAPDAVAGVGLLFPHPLVADARMMAAHLAAAVVVGLWLAAGERAVWTLLTHIWRSLRLPVSMASSTPLPDRAPAPRLAVTTLARIAAGSVVRRGPPRLLAT
ncbi:MAG: hypothetical protein ABWY81_00020 [Jiangellaceae bacterium]